MHRQEQSAASPLCTRAVGASELDILVTHLAIDGASDYNLIGRLVVHDGLVRFQTPHHGHVECVSRVLLHGSWPERRVVVVTSCAQTAYSCILTLLCRATVTVVSSEGLCV